MVLLSLSNMRTNVMPFVECEVMDAFNGRWVSVAAAIFLFRAVYTKDDFFKQRHNHIYIDLLLLLFALLFFFFGILNLL